MSSLKETLNSLNQKVEQQSEDLVFVKIDRTKELEESICSKLEMIKNIKDDYRLVRNIFFNIFKIYIY